MRVFCSVWCRQATLCASAAVLVATSYARLAAAGAGKPEHHKEEAPQEAAHTSEQAAGGSHEAPAEGEEREAGDAGPNPSAGPRGILGNLARTAGAAAGMLSEAPKALGHAGGAANAVIARADAATSHVAGGLRGVAGGVSERAGELGSSVQVRVASPRVSCCW